MLVTWSKADGKGAVKRKQLKWKQQLLTITYRGLGYGSDNCRLHLESNRKAKMKRSKRKKMISLCQVRNYQKKEVRKDGRKQ